MIHAAGVVHRDLMPSNEFMASDGPRIIDLGISRAAAATWLTHAGGVVGSPGFMSPEQAEGHEVGPPSDIFSLGGVLAFAATGEEPFGTGTATALLHRVVHGAPAACPGRFGPWSSSAWPRTRDSGLGGDVSGHGYGGDGCPGEPPGQEQVARGAQDPVAGEPGLTGSHPRPALVAVNSTTLDWRVS